MNIRGMKDCCRWSQCRGWSSYGLLWTVGQKGAFGKEVTVIRQVWVDLQPDALCWSHGWSTAYGWHVEQLMRVWIKNCKSNRKVKHCNTDPRPRGQMVKGSISIMNNKGESGQPWRVPHWSKKGGEQTPLVNDPHSHGPAKLTKNAVFCCQAIGDETL